MNSNEGGGYAGFPAAFLAKQHEGPNFSQRQLRPSFSLQQLQERPTAVSYALSERFNFNTPSISPDANNLGLFGTSASPTPSLTRRVSDCTRLVLGPMTGAVGTQLGPAAVATNKAVDRTRVVAAAAPPSLASSSIGSKEFDYTRLRRQWEQRVIHTTTRGSGDFG